MKGDIMSSTTSATTSATISTISTVSTVELATMIASYPEYRGGYIYPGTTILIAPEGVQNPRHWVKEVDRHDYVPGNVAALADAPVGAEVHMHTCLNDQGYEEETYRKVGAGKWQVVKYYAENRLPDGWGYTLRVAGQQDLYWEEYES